MFSKFEKKILDNYVTSTDDPIYAIKHTIPPEVFGAFGSYFSRNPKDFRENLMDAIKGQIEEEKTNVSEGQLKWLAEGDFRSSSDAIQKGLAKSQGFFRKWYGKYSHKSIANTVWIPMVANNVSQLFARELAYDQLAFFIEQSTRYVEWGMDSMFLDEDVMKSEHKKIFKKSLETSIKSYHDFKDIAVEYYRNNIPFEKWLKWQLEDTLQETEKFQENKYNRETRAAALDVSRFLLPQACKTNIAWILDARSTEFDIAAWKGHPLNEMKEAAELIEKAAGEIAPSLLKYTEKNEYYAEKLNGYGLQKTNLFQSFGKGVDIISYNSDALNESLTYILKRHGRGGKFSQVYQSVKEMDFSEKINWLRKFVEKRGSYDEWIEMDEEFDLTKITFDLQTDIGAIRDWRRHQKWDRSEALYTLDNGVHKPYMVKEMGKKAEEIFDNSIEIAHDSEIKIRDQFPYQAQYVVPMATMHSITMSGGLDQLQYMLWTRSTPQGNFSYREDAFNIAEEVVKIHPWFLGYEKYPEGKNFRQIYDEAPLKGLLNLQWGETALHQ